MLPYLISHELDWNDAIAPQQEVCVRPQSRLEAHEIAIDAFNHIRVVPNSRVTIRVFRILSEVAIQQDVEDVI